MERLGHNQDKKPEREPSRLRRLGAKLVESYIESHRHGNVYVSAVPFGMAFVVPVEDAPTLDEQEERLYKPEDEL